MADEFDPYSKGVEYQVTKVDPTDPTTKGAVYQVHKVDEVTAAMSGKFYRARVIKDPDEPTVKGKVYQIVIIDDPDDPSVKGKVYNAIITGDQEAVVVGPAVPPLDLDSAVADTLTYVKAYGGLLQSGVPSGVPSSYTAVEYVENTTGTMVKTAIHIGNDDNFKIDITATAVSGSFYLFQARDKVNSNLGNANITGISGATSGNTLLGSPGIDGVAVSNGLTRANRTGHKMQFVLDIADGNMSWYVRDLDGNVENTATGTYDPTQLNRATTNMCIYGNEAPAGSGAGQTANRLQPGCKVYGAKLWKNGVLVMDYVPATRDSDSAVGFYDRISHTFITATDGSLTAGNSLAPTPSDPMDIYCNNGALKVLDKSQWTIITNPSSIAGQGAYINTSGKWQVVGDRSEGCVIPLTVGKQYTMVIHKKTIALGTMLRYGQSPRATPTNEGVQLTDWYRGTIADGMMISFVAKQPYFVTQFNADPTEAGMIQEAIEVLEAQGGDYTFLKYIEATGTQYIDTGILAASDIKAEVKFKSNNSTNYCALGGRDTASGTSRNGFAIWANVSSRVRFDFQSNPVVSTATPSTTNWNIAIKDGVKNYLNDVRENDNESATFTSAYNMYLFAMLSGTTGATGQMVGSIAYCKIWKAGVLVRDFIPAIRNSDNVVGMYDTVSGTFFENQGTGVFVAGTVIGDGEVLKLTPSNDTAGVANLFKIDNYVDTQEILTGVINHQLGIFVLNGLETYNMPYSFYIHTDSCDAYITLDNAQSVQTQNSVGICTQLKLTNKDIWSLTAGYPNTFTFNGKQLHLNFAHDVIGTTSSSSISDALTAIKSYIAAQYAAGTPVIVVYPLATEYTEPAPIPQTMQVVAGDNVLDIVQAGMPGLEVEAKYTKEG